MKMMKIINLNTKKVMGEYWFSNPFTGIGNFPTETTYPNAVPNETGEIPSVEPTIINKQAISRFENNTWRVAYEHYDLPKTTDAEDDKKYNDILASYTEVMDNQSEQVLATDTGEVKVTEVTPEEPALPKLTSIEITPVTKDNCIKNTKFDITVAYKDEKGNAYTQITEPLLISVYGLCTINGLSITPNQKGVDIIRVSNEGVVKDLVIKIRDDKPYPDIVQECGIDWVKMLPEEVLSYIELGIITNPELETLLIEKEYYNNELFNETKAWADPAIRAVATAEQLTSVDTYRQSVAEMLNYLNDEIGKLTVTPEQPKRRNKRSVSFIAIPERKRPIIAEKPEYIYEYKI